MVDKELKTSFVIAPDISYFKIKFVNRSGQIPNYIRTENVLVLLLLAAIKRNWRGIGTNEFEPRAMHNRQGIETFLQTAMLFWLFKHDTSWDIISI